MNINQKTFVDSIYTYLAKHAPKFNIRVYSPILAQAILESGWGVSTLCTEYYNIFGLKCGGVWTGKRVTMATYEEYVNGVLTKINDDFRVFDNVEEGVIGYLDFIDWSNYYNLKGITNYKEYCYLLQKDGYATASKYAETLIQIIEENNLTSYDLNKEVKSVEELANEVIEGVWGNGEARKEALTNAGYNYDEVQSLVDEMLKPKETIDYDLINRLALEVIRGDWGNIDDVPSRAERLTEAGYNYELIQSRVDEIYEEEGWN